MKMQIVVHFAELALKGKNRPQFVRHLKRNIQALLQAHGHDWAVRSIHDRIYIDVHSADETTVDLAVTQLQRLPGIAWLGKIHWFEESEHRFLQADADLSPVEAQLLKLARACHSASATFAIRARRSDKNFRMRSNDLARHLGALVLQNTEFERVDLKHPDHCFYLDVSSLGIALHTDRIDGVGGLPLNASGRVMCLLSGGFDSPVAAWLMAKRGCHVDFVHFSASHLRSDQLQSYKVCRIVQTLSETLGRTRLHVLPYTHFDMALLEKSLDYDLMLFRRFMARCASELMQRIHAQALITGDNLAQVASQTLENIISMNASVPTAVLRPLLTYNKDEIIRLSEQLGLFEVCAEPYKDCCALISKNPKTRSRPEVLARLEETHLDEYPRLIEDTLAEGQTLTFEFGRLMQED